MLRHSDCGLLLVNAQDHRVYRVIPYDASEKTAAAAEARSRGLEGKEEFLHAVTQQHRAFDAVGGHAGVPLLPLGFCCRLVLLWRFFLRHQQEEPDILGSSGH